MDPRWVERTEGVAYVDDDVDVAVRAGLVAGDRAEQGERRHAHPFELGPVLPQQPERLVSPHRRTSVTVYGGIDIRCCARSACLRFGGVRVFQELSEPYERRRHVLCDSAPDQAEIDLPVRVNEDVSHVVHLTPCNFRT